MLEEIIRQYGGILIAAIIVIGLIAVAVMFKNNISTWFSSVVTSLMNTINTMSGTGLGNVTVTP